MTKIEKHKCDQCDKEIENRNEHEGWVSMSITDDYAIRIEITTNYGKAVFIEGVKGTLDYCSLEHMVDNINYVKEQMEKLHNLDDKKENSPNKCALSLGATCNTCDLRDDCEMVKYKEKCRNKEADNEE